MAKVMAAEPPSTTPSWSMSCAARSSEAAAQRAEPKVAAVFASRARQIDIAKATMPPDGCQFVIHAKALPGNRYDGHALATVIPEIEALIGNTIARILLDKGYRATTPRRITSSGCLRQARSGG
jgi:hypothetical protein